ncbi:MAG TPA: hypothetical protein VMR62_16425, partial [Bryobacteraceae bacterium]|nr:hypothetical protein [Bryobacteraceae bacterium]
DSNLAAVLLSFRSGFYIATQVSLQLPFWGGVSFLQPMRSIVLLLGAWIPPGNAPIPRAGSGGDRVKNARYC